MRCAPALVALAVVALPVTVVETLQPTSGFMGCWQSARCSARSCWRGSWLMRSRARRTGLAATWNGTFQLIAIMGLLPFIVGIALGARFGFDERARSSRRWCSCWSGALHPADRAAPCAVADIARSVAVADASDLIGRRAQEAATGTSATTLLTLTGRLNPLIWSSPTLSTCATSSTIAAARWLSRI